MTSEYEYALYKLMYTQLTGCQYVLYTLKTECSVQYLALICCRSLLGAFIHAQLSCTYLSVS